ncbi:hypothetical protein MMC06_000047 [Schaereria dolodes]|nr:hypothetical protein [Schaereria dolodes]
MVSSITQLLHNATVLVNALSQAKTNGASLLGTRQAPKLPPFLTNNPIINGFPWGSLSASNTNPYTSSPNTGVVRSYDWTIARGTVAPDGLERSMLLVNGQYPGPTIEANWGDTIQVTVHNQIADPAEGTTMHWHGLLQQYSQWEDGVPGISQCPLPPGSSFTYSFKATLYGTTWYHSHYSSQYAGGLWGPIVVHGPNSVQYDVDLGPVTLNDYYHSDYFSIVTGITGTDGTRFRPASDNNLINGKNNLDCSTIANVTADPAAGWGTCTSNAGLSTFQFTSGKRYRLRLINTSAAGIQKFSIDNHTMTIIANDFTPLQPYDTDIVTLGVGQRTDVVVRATGQPSDSYWMRSTLSSGECTEPGTQLSALATIHYQSANVSAVPSSIAQADDTSPCANEPLGSAIPLYSMAVTTPATTIDIDVNFVINSTGHLTWTMNNSTFRVDYNSPLLLLAKTGNDSYPYSPQYNVYNTNSSSSIRVRVKNLTPTSHPMHLHGHTMQILAEGTGDWDGTITSPSNPNRRDVQLLQANGYLILQWSSDNPGVWPFHCHIAWHVSGGLHVNFLERPADIDHLAIPSTTYQLCRDWAAYTGTTVVDQIDSGL